MKLPFLPSDAERKATRLLAEYLRLAEEGGDVEGFLGKDAEYADFIRAHVEVTERLANLPRPPLDTEGFYRGKLVLLRIIEAENRRRASAAGILQRLMPWSFAAGLVLALGLGAGMASGASLPSAISDFIDSLPVIGSNQISHQAGPSPTQRGDSPSVPAPPAGPTTPSPALSNTPSPSPRAADGLEQRQPLPESGPLTISPETPFGPPSQTGASSSPPGEDGAAPGLGGNTPPGHGGAPPGLGGSPPPGQGGTPPGLDGSPPPGQGGTPPGLDGSPPPGQGSPPPGQGGTPPGLDGSPPPGQGGGEHGGGKP